MKYKSIEEEAEECRKAFAGRDYIRGGQAVYAWHVHHEVLVEFLDEPIENRIAYILSDKPKAEQAIRLRWMRPVLAPKPEEVVKAWGAWDKAREALDEAEEAYAQARGALKNNTWEVYIEVRNAWDKAGDAYWEAQIAWLTPKLHSTELPGCPWNGDTIFP